MTVVACPQCKSQVCLPQDASSQARVQCPLCSGQYPLAEVLEQLPPELVVVKDPLAPAAGERLEEPIAPILPQIQDAPVTGEKPADAASLAGAASAAQDAAAPALRPGSIRPAATRPVRRRQKRFGTEVVKIVAGGVIGILIAHAILWWLPARLRRDPLGMASVVAQFVPWVVPEQFRPPGMAQLPGANDARPQPARTASPGPRKQQQTDALTDTTGSARPEQAQDDRAGPPAATVTADVPVEHLPTASGKAEDEFRSSDQPKASSAAPSSSQRQSSASLEIAAEPPGYTSIDLQGRLEQARGAKTRWEQAHEPPDSLETRRLAAEFYRVMAGLGELLPHFRQRDAQAVFTEATTMLRHVGRSRERLRLMDSLTPAWLRAKRSNEGIFLLAMIGDVQSSQGGYQAELRLTTGKTLPMVCRPAPAENLQPGKTVLLLGALVQNQQQLPGTLDQAPMVVRHGLHVVLGK